MTKDVVNQWLILHLFRYVLVTRNGGVTNGYHDVDGTDVSVGMEKNGFFSLNDTSFFFLKSHVYINERYEKY